MLTIIQINKEHEHIYQSFVNNAKKYNNCTITINIFIFFVLVRPNDFKFLGKFTYCSQQQKKINLLWYKMSNITNRYFQVKYKEEVTTIPNM